VGLKSLKSLNLTNGYPNNINNNNNNNNIVKSKPLELFELAGKNNHFFGDRGGGGGGVKFVSHDLDINFFLMAPLFYSLFFHDFFIEQNVSSCRKTIKESLMTFNFHVSIIF
jgi:hypothetical protein